MYRHGMVGWHSLIAGLFAKGSARGRSERGVVLGHWVRGGGGGAPVLFTFEPQLYFSIKGPSVIDPFCRSLLCFPDFSQRYRTPPPHLKDS
jgi:hypothetical protein